HRVAAFDRNGAEESAISPSSATLPMTSHLTPEVLVSPGKTFPAGPSAVLLNSRELLLAYQTGNAENRRNHAGESIWLRTSHDGHTGWSNARLLLGGDTHTAYGKSALVRMRDGRLGMSFSRWTCDDKGTIIDRKRQFIASADEGNTWSDPV